MTSCRLKLTIPPEREGQKVDTVLRGMLGLSGTVIRRIKWFEDGILLDGSRVFVSARVHAGQVLSVRMDEPERRSGVQPTKGPLDIVYEDDHLVVLNKAPGVIVHPIPSNPTETLGNYLLYHYLETGQPWDFHPVHRLDKGTSGLLVVAKHPHAQTSLSTQLHTNGFTREYLALVEGHPTPTAGTVDAHLAPTPGSPIRHQVATPDQPGQRAITHYETLWKNEKTSLLRLKLDTGRTHQIRVHMAHIGHPLVGDFLYGHQDLRVISRPALHSWKLQFRHPIFATFQAFSQKLPEDMKKLLKS